MQVNGNQGRSEKDGVSAQCSTASFSDLPSPHATGRFFKEESLAPVGIDYQIIDQIVRNIDSASLDFSNAHIKWTGQSHADGGELANLSASIGACVAHTIAVNTQGRLKRNGPHKYPDLVANGSGLADIEIKIALEGNNPKGHHPKSGYYMTCRYVLVDEGGTYVPKTRGTRAVVWEIRFGYLDKDNFSFSDTPGDSGKTAPVNNDALQAMNLIYLNLAYAPYSKRAATWKKLASHQ